MLWRRPVPLPGTNLRYLLGLLTNTSSGIKLIYSGSVELQMGIRKLWDTLKVLGEEVFRISFRVEGWLSWLKCFIMPLLALLFKTVFVWLHVRNLCTCWSQWPRGLRPLACWHCGFEPRGAHGYLSFVIVVCCQLEASASGWSLGQRSPARCGVSEYDREASQGEAMTRNWVEALQNKKLCSQKGGSDVCRVEN